MSSTKISHSHAALLHTCSSFTYCSLFEAEVLSACALNRDGFLFYLGLLFDLGRTLGLALDPL